MMTPLAAEIRHRIGAALAPVPFPYRVGGWRLLVPRGESRYYRAGYEPTTSEWLRRKAARATAALVDVGAHVGYYTLLLHDVAEAEVVAFEPVPSTARLLRTNLIINRCRRARVVEAAAGATARQRDIRLVEGSSQHGFYESPRTRKYASVSVRQVRLDDQLGRIAGAKIDAEGAEVEVLEGMQRLIAESRPWLVVEWAPHIQRAAGRDPQELLRYLTDHGYVLSILDDERDRHLTLATAQQMLERGEDFFVNVAAEPE